MHKIQSLNFHLNRTHTCIYYRCKLLHGIELTYEIAYLQRNDNPQETIVILY